MNLRPFVALLLGGLALTVGSAETAPPTPTLKVGDPAPALANLAWLKGEPVTRFEPGQVYILEFWATWCNPCNVAMPKMSELQKKHAGRLTIIGVDVRERDRPEGRLARIRGFVEKKGDAMAYTVAMDDPVEQTAFNAWMLASGSYGIPATFIIDRAGRLAWVGHPFKETMEVFSPEFTEAVAQALSGTNDLAAARAEQEKVTAQTARRLAAATALQPMEAALQRKDYAGVIAEADQAVRREPTHAPLVFRAKLAALLHVNEDEAFAFARSKVPDRAFLKEVYANTEDEYWGRTVGYTIASEEGLSAQAYQFAADALQKCTREKPADFLGWKALALACHRLGQPAEAVAAQETALALAVKQGFAEDYIADLRKNLALYRSDRM